MKTANALKKNYTTGYMVGIERKYKEDIQEIDKIMIDRITKGTAEYKVSPSKSEELHMLYTANGFKVEERAEEDGVVLMFDWRN